MSSLRQTRWGICKTIVCKYTPNGVQQVFLEGLQDAFNMETITDLSTKEWSNDLRQAYEAQQQIGWSQFFLDALPNSGSKLSTMTQWLRATCLTIGGPEKLFELSGITDWKYGK